MYVFYLLVLTKILPISRKWDFLQLVIGIDMLIFVYFCIINIQNDIY